MRGSHAGTEIGPDGPSQMALEDLAALRALPGSTVLCPSDATGTVQLVAAMAQTPGIVYLRTPRGGYPVLNGSDESFPVGGPKLLRSGVADRVTLIGAGVTVLHCVQAADQLAADCIDTRVLDLYSVKPVDTTVLAEASGRAGGRLVVVQDHYPEGGLGSAVLEALADTAHPPRVVQLAVRAVPGSGQPGRGDGRRWHNRAAHCHRRPAAARCRLTQWKEIAMSTDNMYRPTTPEIAQRRKELAPHVRHAFEAFSRAVLADGALPEKTKQLIAGAVAHTTQCLFCIQGHTRLARRKGASDEEIMEAIWVAAEMRACGAYAHSTLALDVLTK